MKELSLESGEYFCQKRDILITVLKNEVYCFNFKNRCCSYVHSNLADLVDPICSVWKTARKNYVKQSLPKCTPSFDQELCGDCRRHEKTC